MIAGLAGALLGVLLAALVTVGVLRRRAPEQPAVPGYPVTDMAQLVEALWCGAAVVGPHDEIVGANAAAERMGIVRGTRVGIPALLDLIRETRRDQEFSTVDLDLRRGRAAAALKLSARTVPLSAGRVFVVADDRAQMQRVRESSRDFMSNATHELKTPVGAISLLAEATEEAAGDPDAVTRFAGKIRSEAQRLTDLVSQIITLSKLQGESPLIAAGKVDVDEVVSLVIDRCRQIAEGRRVELTDSLAGGLWVRGDAEQLGTAVSNLVANALSYSDAGGRVVVSTRRATVDGEDYVNIAVSDNGIGIPEEDQRRIFERFFRADYARSRETCGPGLGLSIASEIAEGHGGTVTVWSRLGSGSTFTLRLPAAEAPGLDEEEER